MKKVPSQTNYTKLVHEAKKTKLNYTKGQLSAFQKWQKKFGAKLNKLEKLEKKLRKSQKGLEAILRDQKANKEALEEFVIILRDAFKELKTYREIPVKEKLPPPPKNVIAAQSLVFVFGGTVLYLIAVKKFLAVAEANKAGTK